MKKIILHLEDIFLLLIFILCINAVSADDNATGTLTINYTSVGSVIANNTTFIYGTVTAINATPGVKHVFNNWTTNCNGIIANITSSNTTITFAGTDNCYVQANFALPWTVNVSRGCIIGESTLANHSGLRYVSGFLLSPDDIAAGSTINDLSYGGARIYDQNVRWNATSDKNSYDYIIVQLGLNDISLTWGPSSNQTAKMQALIDSINYYKKPGALVILSRYFPEKKGIFTMFGANSTGYTIWEKANNMSADQLGYGSIPITGIDYYITRHYGIMDDGNNSLASVWDTGDTVHENNAARQLVGMAWRQRLQELGFLNTPTNYSTYVSCGTNLNNIGNYYALNDSVNIDGSSCFNITNDYIILDCQGFSIIGNNTPNIPAITTNSSYAIIKNCVFVDFSSAINLDSTSTGNTFYHNNFTSTLTTYINDSGTNQNKTCFQPIPTYSFSCSDILFSSIDYAPNISDIAGINNNANGTNFWLNAGNNVADRNSSTCDTPLATNTDAFVKWEYYRTSQNATISFFNSTNSSNVSIPISCLGDTTIQLLSDTLGSINSTRYFCLNQSRTWEQFASFQDSSFCEQGIYWVINQSNNLNNTLRIKGVNMGAGNIFSSIILGTEKIYGVISSLDFLGYYYGSTGGNYPYNETNSNNKIIGYSVDYAPLTPYYESSTETSTVNYVYGSSSFYVKKVSSESTQSVTYDIPRGQKTILITSTAIPLSEIDIDVKTEAKNVKFIVTATGNSSTAYSEKVYKYIQIDHDALDNSNINNVKLKFKIEKSWLTDNKAKEDIVLMRYVGNDWIPLVTVITSEDNNYIYFLADSSGLSLFAISTKAPADAINKLITDASTNKITPGITTKSIIGLSRFSVWIGAITLIIISIIIVIYIKIQRYRKR